MIHVTICKNCKKEYSKTYKTTFCSQECCRTWNKMHNKYGGDRSSLKYFTTKYGEEEGLRRYNIKSTKLSKKLHGRESGMKGKKHSEKTKNKIKENVKKSKYHINLKENGRTTEEKKKISKYMKGVFSLEWFIRKHGSENGVLMYLERNKNISKTCFFKEYNKSNTKNYSKKSQDLFWNLQKRLCLSKDDTYFAELNHEYSCGTKYNFDFVHKHKKKVIEFNGNIWHGNPILFNENDRPNPYTNETAKEIWNKDDKKINTVKEKGFAVLIIWEDVYDKQPKLCIQQCINFLME